MLSIQDIQTTIAEGFFGGSTEIAGLVIFAIAMLFIITFTKENILMTFLMMLPVTLIFSIMGIITTEMTVLLVLITMLGIGLTAKRMM